MELRHPTSFMGNEIIKMCDSIYCLFAHIFTLKWNFFAMWLIWRIMTQNNRMKLFPNIPFVKGRSTYYELCDKLMQNGKDNFQSLRCVCFLPFFYSTWFCQRMWKILEGNRTLVESAFIYFIQLNKFISAIPKTLLPPFCILLLLLLLLLNTVAPL